MSIFFALLWKKRELNGALLCVFLMSSGPCLNQPLRGAPADLLAKRLVNICRVVSRFIPTPSQFKTLCRANRLRVGFFTSELRLNHFADLRRAAFSISLGISSGNHEHTSHGEGRRRGRRWKNEKEPGRRNAPVTAAAELAWTLPWESVLS